MQLLAALAPILLLCGCPAKPTDTGEVGQACTWYQDTDGDGWGDVLQAEQRPCDEARAGWTTALGDCDDTDPNVHPGAPETCNALDDDCDGFTDDEDPDLTGASTWYPDADGDGWGDDAAAFAACERPADMLSRGGDCDGSDAAVHPEAVEVCDRIDNDCDGLVDEDDAVDAPTWYTDADRDGFGDPASATRACRQPPGSADNGLDCDDGDAAISPAAAEVCNGVDDDCDGTVDEEDAVDAPTWYADRDGDGFGDPLTTTRACRQPPDSAQNGEDCDDDNSAVNPAAEEVCNGVDDDCDGALDEDDASDAPTWYLDGDGDGFGNPAISTRACLQPSGYSATPTDCDDVAPAVNPGATELCNGIDDDCDGAVDEDDALDAPTWYADGDGDGFGETASATRACVAPSGTIPEPGDCDDADPSVHPGASELCNVIDDDCDGVVDEDDALDAPTWYADADGDGYGSLGASTRACRQPSGYTAASTDCDDGNPAVNPAAAEVCNSLDDDCDALVDDDDGSLTGAPTWYLDDDLDGYGDPADTITACAEPSGYIEIDGDCDDSDDDVNPAATEHCDGVDEDCDGSVDEGAGCPCTVQTWGGHGYLFCTRAAYWYDLCDDYTSYGYELVSIGSASEQAWLVTAAAAYSTSRCWWIGFNDRSVERTWVWVSGETVTYTNWGPGQPDNGSGSEDCAEFVASGSGLWNDEQCWTDCYAIFEAP
jgi:hypothetical protein